MRLAMADYLLRQPEASLCEAVRLATLDGLELTYGPVLRAERPWFQGDGPAQLIAAAAKQGISLASLSATYFWWHRLYEAGSDQQREYARLLHQLLVHTAAAGIPVLHLPFYDAPTPNEPEIQRRILDLLQAHLDQAARLGITLALETVWPAEDAHRFVARAGSQALKLAYDVGNACAANRDVVAELTLLREDLAQVRIKDRARVEPFTSLRLGEGGVPFPALLHCLRNQGYDGWLILTPPSGEDAVAEARRNASFLRRLLPVTEPQGTPQPATA